MTQLDLDFVRAQFPAFAQPHLQGKAFFENAGGSYPCIQVINRLERFYRQRKVQPYAPYEISEIAGAEMDEARTRLAAIMGVARDELSFGPSTSANSFVLAQAFREWLKPGDRPNNFMPMVTVNHRGVLGLSWYDRRNSPNTRS